MKEETKGFNLEDIDFEDKSKRKENEKHYKLKDGSFVAAIYNSPIHYWDEKDNCYHTVDNTLVETDDAFENTKGSFKARFAKTPENGTSIMKLEKYGRSIEWEYLPTRKSKFNKAKIKQRIDDAPSSLPTLNSVGHIRYPEVCKNADLEYNVTPTGIKENIVIKAKKGSYKFAFKLKVNGYDVREINDELLFFHTNVSGEEKAEYRMPKLFMTDRNGKRCDNVRFTLEKRSDAEYIFTVIPDAKWINDEYRIFPVMVDPTLEYITLQSNKIESYSVCSNGSVYYTDSTIRKIGFENFTNEYITYFNLPKFELPIGYMLKKAGLTLHVNEARARYFDIFEFSVNDEYGFGYYTSFYKPNGSPDITYLSSGGVDPYIDITPLYQNWLDNNSNYYSMLIKTSFDSCNYCSEVFEFNSENSAYDKPTLMVVYEAESIERKYNPEHSCLDIDLGIAGKGKIDLYNGGFVLQTPLVSKGNKSVPLSYFVYNSMAKNGIWASPKYFDFNNGTYTDIFENTYTLNFLGRFNGVDQYYNKDGLYYECSGPSHSLFMDLEGNRWEENYGKVTFTSKTGETVKYESIEDESGANYTQLTDDHNNKYNFIYNGISLACIISPEETSCPWATYEYNSDKHLTRITYFDYSYAEYHYSGNLLRLIKDSYGNNYEFTYTNAGYLTDIKKYPEYETIADHAETEYDGSYTNETHISYYINRTVVKDHTTVETVYTFDNDGRPLMTYVDPVNALTRGVSTPTCICHYGKPINDSYTKPYKLLDLYENNDENENMFSDPYFNNMQHNADINSLEINEYPQCEWIYKGGCSKASKYYINSSTNSLKITTGIIAQRIKVPSSYDCNTLLFSAWMTGGSKANNPLTKDGPRISIMRKYTLVSGTGEPEITDAYKDCTSDTETFTFDSSYEGWQYGALAIETTLCNYKNPDSTSYRLSQLILYIDNLHGSSDDEYYFNNVRLVQCNSVQTMLNVANTYAYLNANGEFVGSPTISSTIPSSAVEIKNTRRFHSRSDDGDFIKICDSDDDFRLTSETLTNKHTGKIYTTNYEYYDNNRLKLKTDYKGIKHYYKYSDDTGDLEIIRVGVDVTENAGGQVTRYAYDVNRNVISVADNNGGVTRYTYDKYNRITSETDPSGNVITYVYSDKGELTAIKGIDGTNILSTNTLSYNKGLTTAMHNLGTQFMLYYDGEGRRKAVSLVDPPDADDTVTANVFGLTRALENSDNCSDCDCGDCICGDTCCDCDCGDCICGDTCCDCECGDCICGDTCCDCDCGDSSLDCDCGDCCPDCDCGDGDCAVTPVKPVINYAGTVLAQSEHYDDGLLRYDTVTYGNNRGTRVYQNANGDVTNVKYKNGTSWKNLTNITYDGNGKVISATDVPKNVRYEYEYNKRGNLKCIYKVTPYNRAQTASSAEKYVEYYYYDSSPYTSHPDILRGHSYYDTGRVYYYSQKFYGDKMSLDGEVSGIEALSFGKENFTFDSYSRVESRTLKNSSGTEIDSSEYQYSDINLPITVSKKPRAGEKAREESYTYDAAGNILSYSEYGLVESENQNYDNNETEYDTVNSESHEYEYDKLNRLIKEVFDGVETAYTYDEAGNILTKNTLDKTYVYEYNNSRWGDQLTGIAINGDSQSFTYNNIGLPTVYRGKNLTWNVRNLLGKYGTTSFTYDATGMRLTKNNITYEYYGNNLIKETRGTDVIEYVDGTSGKLGFVYNGVPYYYIRNVLGDVKGILDANGNLVAEYKYDAFGNHKVYRVETTENSYTLVETDEASFIGNINPIRYRGYYFDVETGLYYLQTRYYDTEIGRFISPDSTKYLDPETLGGLNLYAYCNNNPVMYADPSGNSLIVAILSGAVIGLASQLTSDFVTSAIEGELSFSHWSVYLGAVVGGAVSGAIGIKLSSLGADLVGTLVGSLTSAISYNIQSLIIGRDDMFSSEEIFYTTATNMIVSMVSSIAFDNSKFGSLFVNAKTGSFKKNLGTYLSGSGIAIANGVKETIPFPNTHTWSSPDV